MLEYRKEPNPAYKPLTDVFLNEGEFMVNRTKVALQTIEEFKHIIRFNVDSIKAVIPVEKPLTEIVVESKFADDIQSSQLKLVKLKEYYDKKEKETLYGLTYEDVVKDTVQPKEVETSRNKITKIVFTVKEKGIYSLCDFSKKKAILFKID